MPGVFSHLHVVLLSLRSETGETLPMAVAVGDRVLLPEWGSNKIEMEGEEFHIIREGDIVAKITE